MALTDLKPLTGPDVWDGKMMAATDDWRHPIEDRWVAEIDAALAQTKAQGLRWQDITKDAFPLDEFAGELQQVQDDLEDGMGIVKFSGLPVERYSEDDRRRIFFGIGCHIGMPVYQSAEGELMGDIRDEGAEAVKRGVIQTEEEKQAFLSSRARVQTTSLLRWHTDRTDVVGLLCVRPAAKGGISKVVGTMALYNEILRRRPDLLALLCRPYPRSLFGQETGGRNLIHDLPIFCEHNGKFTSYYSRTYVEAAQKIDGVPPLSDAQVEALDLLAEVAEELCYQMHFAPGDMQFLNNHVVYHARSAFEDDDTGGRLLHRIWLSMPNGRALPDSYKILWRNVEAGVLRGGIAQKGEVWS